MVQSQVQQIVHRFQVMVFRLRVGLQVITVYRRQLVSQAVTRLTGQEPHTWKHPALPLEFAMLAELRLSVAPKGQIAEDVNASDLVNQELVHAQFQLQASLNSLQVLATLRQDVARRSRRSLGLGSRP